MKSLMIIAIFLLNIHLFAQGFDESILKELETISKQDTKKRNCQHQNYALSIPGDTEGTITISSSIPGLPKTRKYFIYEESADFILAENMSMVNVDYLKGNLTPALVILKKKDKSLIIEGLSLKFQKNGMTENCLSGKSINNLHCLSRQNGKANLRSFANKITLEYKGNLIRDIASEYKKMEFNYDFPEFHSQSIRVGKGGDLNRSVVLHNSNSTVNLTYSHKSQSSVLANCNLKL